MDKSVQILSEHEVFMREFIALYKQQPVLWDQKHPQYRSRAERTEAYELLVRICREYYPEADEDFVKMKIDSMRCSFRKERRKVLSSRENSEDPEDIYKPSLWYYDLLLFTVGEAEDTDVNNSTEKIDGSVHSDNPENGNIIKIPFWGRSHTAMLINFYKSSPCLYSSSHPHYRNKRKRDDAVKKITEKLMSSTGKYFNADDVKRKISLIRGQFLHEFKKIEKRQSREEVYQPTLWCFKLLSFLTKEYNKGKNSNKKNQPRLNLRHENGKNNTSDDSDDDDIKKESDSSVSTENLETTNDDDIFDTIAKNVAYKLRHMTEEQRIIAERIVKDVMYHGQMENLTTRSRLNLS